MAIDDCTSQAEVVANELADVDPNEKRWFVDGVAVEVMPRLVGEGGDDRLVARPERRDVLTEVLGALGFDSDDPLLGVRDDIEIWGISCTWVSTAPA